MPGTKQMKQVRVQTYKGWQIEKPDKVDIYYASKGKDKLKASTSLLDIRKDIRRQEANDKWLGYSWHTFTRIIHQNR